MFLLRKGRGHPALSDLSSTSAFEPLDPFCFLLVRACLPPEEASNLTWGLTRWQSGALSSPNKTSSSNRGEESPSEECCKGNTRSTKTQAPITNHDPQDHQHQWSKLINCLTTRGPSSTRGKRLYSTKNMNAYNKCN